MRVLPLTSRESTDFSPDVSISKCAVNPLVSPCPPQSLRGILVLSGGSVTTGRAYLLSAWEHLEITCYARLQQLKS